MPRNIENKKEWWKTHYQNNRKYYLEKNQRRKRLIRETISKIKADKGCMLCPERDPVCLDFHHRDGDTKIENISKLMEHRGMKIVFDEIEKCDVLCANCHRKLTRDMKNRSP